MLRSLPKTRIINDRREGSPANRFVEAVPQHQFMAAAVHGVEGGQGEIVRVSRRRALIYLPSNQHNRCIARLPGYPP